MICSVLDSKLSLLLEVVLTWSLSLAAWNVQKSSELLNGNLFPTDFDFFKFPKTSLSSPEHLCLLLKLLLTKEKQNFQHNCHKRTKHRVDNLLSFFKLVNDFALLWIRLLWCLSLKTSSNLFIATLAGICGLKFLSGLSGISKIFQNYRLIILQ